MGFMFLDHQDTLLFISLGTLKNAIRCITIINLYYFYSINMTKSKSLLLSFIKFIFVILT